MERRNGQTSRAEPVLLAVLCAILVGAFALRAQEIDAAPVGYHNVKENEYLSQTLRYRDAGLTWRRQVHFFEGRNPEPYWEGYKQLPLLPWVGFASWQLFGQSYWALRLQIIAYSLGTLVLGALLTRRITGDGLFAVSTAAVMAVVPVSVFFGRNFQPDIPALFWLMAFFLAFHRWGETRRPAHAAAAGLCLALVGLLKVPFLVPAAAAAVWIPWRRLPEDLKSLRLAPYLPLGLFLLCPAIFYLMGANDRNTMGEAVANMTRVSDDPLTRLHPLDLFSPAFWERHGGALWRYTADNYTAGFAVLAGFGLLLLLVHPSLRGHRGFFVGSMAAGLLYVAILLDFLNQHSYYQLPLLYLVCVAIAFPLVLAAQALAKRTGVPALRFLVFPLLALNGVAVAAGIERHFGTKTVGIDVAGREVRSATDPDERFMFMGTFPHLGVCTFAERFCIRVPPEASGIEEFEAAFGARFVYVAAEHMRALRKLPSWPYLAKNYRVRHLALMELPGGGHRRVHYLLERGGTFAEPIGAATRAPVARTYRIHGGEVALRILEP